MKPQSLTMTVETGSEYLHIKPSATLETSIQQVKYMPTPD